MLWRRRLRSAMISAAKSPSSQWGPAVCRMGFERNSVFRRRQAPYCFPTVCSPVLTVGRRLLRLPKHSKNLGPFDVVLAGEKATDGETGQVGPEVAALLNIPCATYVSSIKFTGSHIIAERSIEDGRQTQKIQLPCLLTVLNNINEPQMPTLSGKKRARRMPVAVLSAEDP